MHDMLEENKQVEFARYIESHSAGDCVYMPVHREDYIITETKFRNELPDDTAYPYSVFDGLTFAHDVSARDYVCTSDFENDIKIEAFCVFELQSDNTYAVSVTRYINELATIYDTYTLPTEYHGIPCTTVRKFQTVQFRNLIIPDSYTKIEDYAFFNAWYLQSLTIQGHPSIGQGAFNGCAAEPVYSAGN